MNKPKTQKSNSSLDRLVKIVSNHFPGDGCKCAAYGECECGCGVDWRSRREVAAVTALKYCIAALKSYHTTKPGITTLIRNTETIMQAGEYKRNK
jgi:hypothetical protein